MEPSRSSFRLERKTIEKNRRIHMKSLYAKLDSILPPPSKESAVSPLPDKVEEVINYIKGLQARVEVLKEKKAKLLSMDQGSSSSSAALTTTNLVVEEQDLGSGFRAISISSRRDGLVFHEAVRLLLEEQGVELLNVHMSVVGDTTFHTIHSKVREELEVGEMAEKLKKALRNACVP